MEKGFDLEELATKETSEQGVKMVVEDIYGKPVKDSNGDDVYIILAGADSKRFKEGSVEARKAVMAGKRKMEEQDIEAIGHYTKAECTLGWSGIVANGEAVECNKENAQALYERYPDLNDQVATFMADRANFIKVS